MSDQERRKRWEERGVVYDDQATPDNEAPAAPAPPEHRQRGRQALRELGGPDQADVRWVRGARGWLSLRDPVTLERVEVPTKYAEGLPPGAEVAPPWMVRRAMEKLPPRPPKTPAAPQPRKLPPVPDDGGPL